MSVTREAVRFVRGDIDYAAWYYPGTTGACVIMAGGLGVPKGPGTDLFAPRFAEAGIAVLAFDYRNFGESGGEPRQVARIADQIDDWHAAIAYARSLPGIDPARIGLWAFSASGGHVLRVAAADHRLAAVVAQTPNVDGLALSRNAARYQRPGAMLRLTGRAVLDAVGGLLGRPPRRIPLAGPPGTVALLNAPDALDGTRALRADRYPEWRQEVAARAVLSIGTYRPGRVTPRIRCPLLVLVCDQDQVALAEPSAQAVRRAPRGELVRMPGGHYEPFLGGHERAVEAELSFLRRHLLRADVDVASA